MSKYDFSLLKQIWLAFSVGDWREHQNLATGKMAKIGWPMMNN